MKRTNPLENVDIENLDAFEQTMYHDYIRHMSKPEALQRIINNAQGDYTKLSESLSEIAEEQENK